MEDNKIQRLILKKDDVLVVKVEDHLFHRAPAVKSIVRHFRKALLPKKNKILIVPHSFDISVIGSEKVEEYISNIDLWSLWDDEKFEESQ